MSSNVKTTVKRTSLALSKEDMRMLKALGEFYGENESQVLKRALAYTYFNTCPSSTEDSNQS